MKKIGIYALIILFGTLMFLKGSNSKHKPQPCEDNFYLVVDSLVQMDSILNEDGIVSPKEYDEFLIGKLDNPDLTVSNKEIKSLSRDQINYCKLISKL